MGTHANSAALLVAAAITCSLAPSSGGAQTVQLPTYRVFSTNSSVLVPDRGAAYLGGNTSVRSGASNLGLPILGQLPLVGRPFRNRAFGRDVTGRHSWVTAQIIDHRQWDAAVLQEARRQRLAQAPASPADIHRAQLERQATFLTQHVGHGTARGGTPDNLAPHRTAVLPPRDDAALRLGSTPARRLP